MTTTTDATNTDRARAAPERPRLLSRWRRAGYAFRCDPADEPVNMTQLLIDTLKHVRAYPDLYEAATTWLSEFGRMIPWRYLVARAVRECTAQERAILGHMLETSDAFVGASRFTQACERLMAWSQADDPLPLSLASEGMREYVRVLAQYADPISSRWGVLTGDVSPRFDVLDDEEQVLRRNPEWAKYLLAESDIERSMLAFLEDAPEGLSKAEIARRCRATPGSMHDPARRLMTRRRIEQIGRCRGGRLRLLLNAR